MGSIVIDFLHIDNGITNIVSLPLGINGGICIDRYAVGYALGQSSIQIPALEGIPVSGGIYCRKRHSRAIGYRSACHIGATVGIIAQLEIFSCVIDRQLLTGLLCDLCVFRFLQLGVRKAFDRRCHLAV